ncbi:hypothetical protein L210DRAFT_3647669 [Boletus edulis BED1]|uniref:Uncharacterized protein n=1 Tax=Boletus edulis BED1 TaxID=1328754 RepID=A0AAD4BPM5_BOLED|nr:hypothetical protein L210DRAFT_3647669 [Boletus edulis BED1]
MLSKHLLPPDPSSIDPLSLMHSLDLLNSSLLLLNIDPALHPAVPSIPSSLRSSLTPPASILLLSSSDLSTSSSLSSNMDPGSRPLSTSLSSESTVSTTSSFSSISLPEGSSSQPARVTMADTLINPRYASQLCPIFVDHIADVHERAEQKCWHAQEVLQDKKRARKRVVAFSFTKNNEPPVTVDFQNRFSYPYFRLTAPVLDDLELVSSGPNGDKPCQAVHYFDSKFDTWVKMKVNSIIELS